MSVHALVQELYLQTSQIIINIKEWDLPTIKNVWCFVRNYKI